MYYRQQLAGILAMLVSLVGVQPASFAGQGKLLGHVVTVGHHHIRQPDPPKQSIPTVNVRDFGATGNGVTDDTTAIQNAIAAAQGNGEGVLFPAGTYLHNSIIYANGVSLIGVGGASVLLANNPNATAVVLTGLSPSIQNIVVNSGPAGTGVTDFTPFHTTLLVEAAQNFVVQGITIVQGTGRVGTLVQQSAVGNVSSVTYDGTGSTQDIGIIVDSCTDVSVLGNLFLSEFLAISAGGISAFVNNSIAVIGNSINTSVINAVGIVVDTVEVADVSQNQVQLGATGISIDIFARDSNSVTQNVTSGGDQGLAMFSSGSFNAMSQNIARNCRQFGAFIQTNPGTGNVAFLNNQFGECGTGVASEVIQLHPGVGPNDITVFNNVYAGHANLLTNFMSSSAHLNFVSGNTQTQTALPNNIP